MAIRLLLKTLCILSLALPSYAQDVIPYEDGPVTVQEPRFSDAVVFSRQKLTIDAMRLVEVPQAPAPADEEIPEGSEEESLNSEDTVTEEAKAEPQITYEEQAVAYAFDVMVRPLSLVRAGSLQQLGWMKHDEGMMLIFEENDVVSLADLGITAAVDILFIRPNGHIDAIAPNITPEQMSGAVETRKPVIAALLLNAGMSEHLKLEPGNQVNHKHFQPDTRVIR